MMPKQMCIRDRSTEVPGVFFEDVHFVDTLLTLSYRISRG